jgi:nucleoside-diphosphate-sugar epimerase
MRCFLIGSTGFVGSQIKSSLEADGLEVFTLLRAPHEANLDLSVFSTEPNGDFSMENLSEFIASKNIDSVVHCGNVFDPSPNAFIVEKMLYANILIPAKVLRAAAEASATTFVNLGSGWQLDAEKSLNSPDYVATKQAFRALLSHYSGRLHTTTVFANEIFGVGDRRDKLLNQAVHCAINKVHMTVQSAGKVLGFANVNRLGTDIAGLLRNPTSRPKEYVFQNYSNTTVGDLLETVGFLAGELSWSARSEEIAPAPVVSLEIFGERPREDFLMDIHNLLEFEKFGTVQS